MKIIKIKGDDTIIAHAEKIEIQDPQAPILIQRGKNLYRVDEWGNKHLMIGGCNAGFDVVDFDGDIPNDVLDGYELVDGKLKKVKP